MFQPRVKHILTSYIQDQPVLLCMSALIVRLAAYVYTYPWYYLVFLDVLRHKIDSVMTGRAPVASVVSAVGEPCW